MLVEDYGLLLVPENTSILFIDNIYLVVPVGLKDAPFFLVSKDVTCFSAVRNGTLLCPNSIEDSAFIRTREVAVSLWL